MSSSNTKKASCWRSSGRSATDSVATTDADAGTPPDEPAAKKTSRAGRDLPAAIAVGASIGAVLIATLVFAPHGWVILCSGAIFIASHEVVRRLREAGYVIPVIPLLIGGQVTVWLTWPYDARRRDGRFRRHGGGLHVLAAVHAPGQQKAGTRSFRRFATVVELPARRVGHRFPDCVGARCSPPSPRCLSTPKEGAGRVFCLMITVVASDVGGYAFGVLFGKHPLVPAISPKKSWEGFGGSLLFGTTAAVLTATFLAHRPPWDGRSAGSGAGAELHAWRSGGIPGQARPRDQGHGPPASRPWWPDGPARRRASFRGGGVDGVHAAAG